MTSDSLRDALIPHQSLNSTASVTVLLIHGSLSSGEEWNLVAPHLQGKYHLLIPDLPCHGNSSSITPFTIKNTNRLLARLIQTEAKDGVTHIVGLSLGAHVVAHFAAVHPDLVLSVFATGMSRFAMGKNAAIFSYIFYGFSSVERSIPNGIIQRLLPDVDLNISRTSCTVALCREILEFMKAMPNHFPKRTLVVAASKGGLIPTNDNLEDAKFFGEMAGKGPEGDHSECVKHDGMRHAWSRQDAQLFAQTIEAWVDRGHVITEDGFERLS